MHMAIYVICFHADLILNYQSMILLSEILGFFRSSVNCNFLAMMKVGLCAHVQICGFVNSMLSLAFNRGCHTFSENGE